MNLAVVALAFGAAASLGLNLAGTYRRRRAMVYVFKPLTTSICIVIAFLPSTAAPQYRIAIVAGLLFSLAGDVFLMLPRDRFIAGLASFLVAHVAYLVAFTTGVPFAARPLFFVAYAAAGTVAIVPLWPHLGKLRVPVLAYVIVILAMAAQAAALASVLASTGAMLAAIGAFLFVVSDTTLAFDRFRRSFAAAQFIIMTTYVAAQLLIASSVVVR